MSESNRRFELTVLSGSFAMLRLAADASAALGDTAEFFSVTFSWRNQ
jgi:hypothetical protein